jgi:hypothetical protein
MHWALSVGFIGAWLDLLRVESRAMRGVGRASTCSILYDVCQDESVSKLAMKCMPCFVVHRASDAVAQPSTMRENTSDA